MTPAVNPLKTSKLKNKAADFTKTRGFLLDKRAGNGDNETDISTEGMMEQWLN